MWKLLINIRYIGVTNGNTIRPFVFEFNTETAAKNAAEFYKCSDTYTKVIPDPK